MRRFRIRVGWSINVSFAHVWKSLRTLTPETRTRKPLGTPFFAINWQRLSNSNALQVTAFRIIQTNLFSSETPKNTYIFTRFSIPGDQHMSATLSASLTHPTVCSMDQIVTLRSIVSSRPYMQISGNNCNTVKSLFFIVHSFYFLSIDPVLLH